MKTLVITEASTGDELDRVHLSPDGHISYDTGRASSMFDTLTQAGLSESEAFEMRTGWSNGYVTSNLA